MDNNWKKALAILEKEVNEQVFSAWFIPIQHISSTEDSIVLGIPNKFFENWIKDKYYSLINNALQQSFGKKIDVKFQITAPAKKDRDNDIKDNSTNRIRTEQATINRQDPSQTKEPSKSWLKSVFNVTKQIPESQYREIGLNPNYTFDNFVVGSSNRFAHAASLAVCERLSKVYNPLFLYGGVGLGKTHLMQAMGHETLKNYPKAKVLYISSEEFTNQLIKSIRTKTTERFRALYRNVDILLIDDIQFIAGKESTQEEFFHTFNSLHDAHKQIVLCSDRSPKEIKSLEERLISRFTWGLTADLQLPDFETRIAIMEKKSDLEAINVPKEILYFLAENIKTNIREMEGALIRVVAYAKLTGETLSVELAKKTLKGMILAEERRITIDYIQKIVADYCGIKETDMKTKKRSRAIAYPRQMAMYLSRKLTDHSLPDIGGFFGGRDHTTVIHACDKICKEIESKEETKKTIEKLISLIKK